MDEIENKTLGVLSAQNESIPDEERQEELSVEAVHDGIGEVLEVIRFESRDSRLSSAQTFEEFGILPDEMNPVAFSRALAAALTSSDAPEISDSETQQEESLEKLVRTVLVEFSCDDIEILEGGQGALFYSSDYMTDSYARWSYLASEGDDAATFAFCVREESRTYPRPMKASSLDGPPFSLSEARLAKVFEEIQRKDDFADIRTTSASNGDVYYYSTDCLSDCYAQSLAEWYSVERWESY